MPDDRLTPAEAAERLGVSRDAVYVLNSRKENGFPEPVYIGRTPMWTSSQLDAWRAAHPSKRPARRRGEPKILERSPARERHTLRAHLAFATAPRRSALTTDLHSLAEHAMHTVARELDAEVEQFRSQARLIEITVRYPVEVSVSNLAKRLKGAAERAIRQSGRIDGHIWAKHYYAASVGAHSSAGLRRYVEHLEQPAND
jgi:REP element-mobilizing transposase RayT/predicted DNA-binding transcriptional regulator AlpA